MKYGSARISKAGNIALTSNDKKKWIMLSVLLTIGGRYTSSY